MIHVAMSTWLYSLLPRNICNNDLNKKYGRGVIWLSQVDMSNNGYTINVQYTNRVASLSGLDQLSKSFWVVIIIST